MASEGEAKGGGRYPQDLVAIFHASFHPTKGNVVDWSLKASDELNLDELQLEFSALPSGLHLVEQDVVYFTKESQHGVCIFRRRKTGEQGHRGFRLSSLGILLAKSERPRPWRHVKELKQLITEVHRRSSSRRTLEGNHDGAGRPSLELDITEEDWEPARLFFEERKLRRVDLGGAGRWSGWSDELDGAYAEPFDSNPTLHLPHLLRILGPSSLTLYKHVLGRKRILIYTLPPVEVACILCQVAGDICFDTQSSSNAGDEGDSSSTIGSGRLKGRHQEPVNVLGMITLADLDRLEKESQTGRGWIACTTDAIFMDKPSHYDLLIDLTTSTPNKATRPTFHASKPVEGSYPVTSTRKPEHRLSTIRFAWSDVKLWTEIDRILQLDSESAHNSCCSSQHHSAPPPSPSTTTSETKSRYTSSLWSDAWRVYEDVCIICASLWIGSWRGNSAASYSTANGPENWGSVRLEGDDFLSLKGLASRTYVRNLGMGIEGRPVSDKATRRASAMSWSSGKATVVVNTVSGKARQPSSSSTIEPSTSTSPTSAATELEGLGVLDEREHDAEEEAQRRNAQVNTAMAVLQTFHAHTAFQLSVLEELLIERGLLSGRGQEMAPRTGIQGGPRSIILAPKDILAFELGPMSSFDAKYLEWLVIEYATSGPHANVDAENFQVIVKRSWRDLIGVFFGY
ncbi:hypothetical protein CPB83DRAFT_810102 [Crepidotus variabilis]|uniref:Protein LCHN n=1 Tax=Crepidotus variabilis TaxID=179855 RepID=A0A9P6JRE7_9AGAR|nr:hypothetical protein CPB83DRAFT_810102 [Crepidotus variabilis]